MAVNDVCACTCAQAHRNNVPEAHLLYFEGASCIFLSDFYPLSKTDSCRSGTNPMHQVFTPGLVGYRYFPVAAPAVMKVFTVTIIDEPGRGESYQPAAVQRRWTVTYDHCARTVASVAPPVINIRL